ncbi:hypothetical protein [Halopiger xanaduensis]|uniref:Uncharacterized protein n=1 Tax=Halopiger xanaduensis (strain DSM 18323 / JCM 14033 / SH-6) TaxID=797210 RepID=F8D4E8_HALXS|nr:hypothetical protein [Halopiger xanaduensis]AEH38691.1 hypothetical protein Halxa_4086 [Halopiger xanaduensis SH-6]
MALDPAVALAPALLAPDLLGVIGILVLLVGVPLFVIAVIAVLTGYIQQDAATHLEELEEAGELEEFEPEPDDD